ncbi:MAG: two-component regulator propeller domain-containing protein [Brumimicrobium sp.]
MKSNIFLLISILIILTSCNGQAASNMVHKQTTSTIGDTVSELSNSIFIVFQATNGIYWFGSDKDGLYKVDGKIITHFTTKDGLNNNRIRGIQEDKQGNIYISTLEGINKFDGQTFTTLTAVKENNWRLHPDDLWFSMAGKNGDKGPYRYDGKNLYQLEFPKHHMEDAYFAKFPNKAWSPYEVYSIYKDSIGNIWFGTSNFGVCRYDGISLSWLYEDHLTNTPNGGSFGIRSVIEDTNGAFWICNTNYRYIISPDSIKESDKVLIKYERQKGIEGIKSTTGNDGVYFMSAINDNRGNLWLATYAQGVWCYNGESAKQYVVKDSVKNATLYSIYKDKKGEIWLGTHEAGAYKFNGHTFEKFTP